LDTKLNVSPDILLTFPARGSDRQNFRSAEISAPSNPLDIL
jgi:hypothetical protein